jgi:hypothetical protein
VKRNTDVLIFTEEQKAHMESNKLGPAVKVDRWYDRSYKIWTAFPVDAKGYQVGDAQHAHCKTDLSLKLEDYEGYDY